MGRAGRLGFDESTKEMSVENENDWVITLLGRGSVEHSLGRAVEILKEQGVELDRIEMPTDAEQAAIESGSGYTWIKVYAYGTPDYETVMCEDYRELADERAMDVVVQRES